MLFPVQCLFLQKMTDFQEQCVCIKLLFQIGKIGAETFQMLTFVFREEAMRQTVVIDCSAESRNGMTSVKDAEYSGCLPTSRMYRNVGHVYGIGHKNRCITIHKLAKELGSHLVYAIKFWHKIEFMIDCVNISALYASWWAETIRIASVCTRTLRRKIRHSQSFQRSLWMTTWDLPAWSRQRSLFLCKMLTDVNFDVHGIVCHEFVLYKQTEPTFLADIL